MCCKGQMYPIALLIICNFQTSVWAGCQLSGCCTWIIQLLVLFPNNTQTWTCYFGGLNLQNVCIKVLHYELWTYWHPFHYVSKLQHTFFFCMLELPKISICNMNTIHCISSSFLVPFISLSLPQFLSVCDKSNLQQPESRNKKQQLSFLSVFSTCPFHSGITMCSCSPHQFLYILPNYLSKPFFIFPLCLIVLICSFITCGLHSFPDSSSMHAL